MDTSGGDSAQLPLKQSPGSTMDLHQMPPGHFYFTWRVEAEQVLSSRKAQPGLVKERGSPEREPRRMVCKDQPPFLCLVLQPCWTAAHHTLSQPPASALLRLSGPLPSCLRSSYSSSNSHLKWEVFSPPAHPVHPPRVIEPSALWAGFPWSTSPLNCHSCWPLCVPPGLRAHWWPGLALKEDSRNICWAEKNLVLPSALRQGSLRHPHGWGSGLLVRTPKQGHFTHVLWNFSQYSVTLSPNNIHVSALH